MLKVFIALVLCFSIQCHAAYLGGATPSKMYGAGTILFGVDNEDSTKVCDYWGRSFKFDATTASGKNMLSILLSATLAGKKVDIWYSESTAPGTNHTNGCSSSAIAVIHSIGLS